MSASFRSRNPLMIASLALVFAFFVASGAAAVTRTAGPDGETPPDIVTGPQVDATETSSTSAVVRWTTDLLSSSVVEFGATEALGATFRKIVPIEETEVLEINHSITLWELEPATTYFYRTVSETEGGGRVVSDIGQFRTEAAAPPLSGITVTSPASGTSVDAGVLFVGAETDGEADWVNVEVFDSDAGADEAPVVSGQAKLAPGRTLNWELSVNIVLDPGPYEVVALAGATTDGQPVVVESPPVAFVVPAPTASLRDVTVVLPGQDLAEGEGVRSAALEIPAEFDVEVRTGGEAFDVRVFIVDDNFNVANEAVGTPAPLVDDVQLWTFPPLTLDVPGTYALTAEASGVDPAGTEITLSDVVELTVASPEPVAEPEPVEAEERDVEPEVADDLPIVAPEPPPEPSDDDVNETVVPDEDPAPPLASATGGARNLARSLGLIVSDDESPTIDDLPGLRALGLNDGQVNDLLLECDANDIDRAGCGAWLRAVHGDRRCADAGRLTKESCAAYLTERNAGVFPGCEGVTPAECRAVRTRTLLIYPSAATRETTNDIIRSAIEENRVLALEGMSAISPGSTERAIWWPSFEEGETAPAMVIFDADKDGLPDAFELLNGTDPENADTDGDGDPDLAEFQNGTNPLGEGELDKAFSPLERVLIGQQPIQQPLGVGEADPGFTIVTGDGSVTARIGTTTGTAELSPLTLSGTAEPNSVVTIFVYSYIPVVYAATTDENGDFTVEVGNSVVDGDHEAYVVLTDETGRVERRSNPLSFFVREARAVTQDELIDELRRPRTLALDEDVSGDRTTFLYAAAALVMLAVGATLYILNRGLRGKAGGE